MDNQPIISVVIPCYNAARYIAATVRSVLAQTYKNIEIIVVDDGSSDNTSQIVSSEFPFARLIKQENQGVAAARNTGIANCTGSWIAFLDADDIWLPAKLEKQMAALIADPEVRLCYSSWVVWESLSPEPERSFLQQLLVLEDSQVFANVESAWLYNELLLDCVVWTSVVVVHKSIFEEIGVFNANLAVGEDYDLWIRSSRVTKVLKLSQPLALYRQHPNSITKHPPHINYRALVVNDALSRWGLISPDGVHADKQAVFRHLSKTWVDFAYSNMQNGNNKVGRSSVLMAIKLDWKNVMAWRLLFKSLTSIGW